MKKFFVYSALLTAMFLMVGCGGSSSNNSSSNNDQAECTYGTYECQGKDSFYCGYHYGSTLTWKLSRSCKDECDPETGKCNDEGLLFGIIGFNKNLPLNTKDIDFLDDQSDEDYKSFIDNLSPDDGTSLYFADYTALEMMRNHQKPKNLKNVALITFTDGLDNLAMGKNYNPEKYTSKDKYLDALHKMIVSKEGIHGKEIEAYAIGLQGKEEGIDIEEFENTMTKLAKDSDFVYMADDMEIVKDSFGKIAESLYNATTTVNLDVKVPGGYDPGQLLRFTFDQPNSATDSELYIEAAYNRSDEDITLKYISYHGFVKGKKQLSGKLDDDGAYYHFVFEDLKYEESKTSLSSSDINRIQLWVQNKNKESWKTESEFGLKNSVDVEEHRSSALIMLVLDCTISLGPDFKTMQIVAKEFIDTLVGKNRGNNNGGSNNGGDNGGSNNGGDNGNSDNPWDTNPVSSDYRDRYSEDCSYIMLSDDWSTAYENSSSEGQEYFMSYYNCMDDNECFDIEDTDSFIECEHDYCYDELHDCFLTDTYDCMTLNQCLGSCSTDEECQSCIDAASSEATDRYLDLYNCEKEHCLDYSGTDDFEDCIYYYCDYEIYECGYRG